MSSRTNRCAISLSLQSLGSTLKDEFNDDFIAQHTIKIASTTSGEFDGSFLDLKVSTRNTFNAKKPQSMVPDDEFSKERNIRTKLGLARACEMITMALMDVDRSSYGKSCFYGDGPRHSYTVEKIKFDPSSCTWNATVQFSSEQLIKSSTERMVLKVFNGSFTLKVVCTAVVMKETNEDFDDDDDDSFDGNMISNLDLFASKHHSIDITCSDLMFDMRLAQSLDPRIFENNIAMAMGKTLNCISYDISKQLEKHNLPSFPEGCKDQTFRSVYQLNAKIKSGSFGTVCVGTHRKSGNRVAIKCVQKKKLSPHEDSAIFTEVRILSTVQHDRICNVIDFFDEKDWYFIVMPLMEGGDVFDRVGKLNNYSEDVARNLIFQMLRGIAFLHEKNIAHCDLKPKNLLLKSKEDDSSVVLADFGFATEVYAPMSISKQCGTPYFVAPEIILGDGYDTRADMWSVGVIAYSLLSGSLPFNGRRHLDLYKNIMSGQYTFDKEKWDGVSDGAKDFVRRLLVVDPSERFTCQDALNHKWIRAESRMLRRNGLRQCSMRIRTFNARLKFKTAILATQSVFHWKSVTRHSALLKEELFGLGADDLDELVENDEEEEK